MGRGLKINSLQSSNTEWSQTAEVTCANIYQDIPMSNERIGPNVSLFFDRQNDLGNNSIIRQSACRKVQDGAILAILRIISQVKTFNGGILLAALVAVFT